MLAVKNDKDLKLQEFNAEILEVNQNVSLLQNTIKQLKQNTERFLFEGEEKTKLSDIKSVISKSNALKRAAQQK